MKTIALITRKLRELRIHMLEQDLHYAIASSDAHIAGLEKRLGELRREQWKDITAADIARRMDAGKLA